MLFECFLKHFPEQDRGAQGGVWVVKVCHVKI